MSKPLPCTITNNSITISFEGRSRTVFKDSPLYEELLEAIRNAEWDIIPDKLDLRRLIFTFSEGYIQLKDDGSLYIDDTLVPDTIGERIVEFAKNRLPYMPLVLFFRNLNQNPSNRALNGLYRFLTANHFPLTPDGQFLAYKKVDNSFKDFYTKTMDNSVGKVVEVPRNQVDEDPNRTCSHGLHVASYNYAHRDYHGGQGITIEVKVNPRDVVAVPTDYNDSKMRVCRYEVVGLSEGERKEHLTTQYDSNDDYAQEPHSPDDCGCTEEEPEEENGCSCSCYDCDCNDHDGCGCEFDESDDDDDDDDIW